MSDLTDDQHAFLASVFDLARGGEDVLASYVDGGVPVDRAKPRSLARVNAPSSWGRSPRESIEQECARLGRDVFVVGCIELLEGRDADANLIVALGGPPARWAVTGEPAGPPYWLRVWAARGLLWVWDDAALPSLMGAFDDEAWRVREMALRVVARHGLGDVSATVADLEEDSSPRVRAAASRALARLAATDA